MDLPAFLNVLKKMGRPISVSIITAFRGEPLGKLLSANGFAGAKVCQSIEKALKESGSNSVVFSCDTQDLMAADMSGVSSTNDITSPESVLCSLGIKKQVHKAERRAA